MLARDKRQLNLALGALAAITWPALEVQAAWEFVPNIGLTTEVDDNARLLIDDQPESTRAVLDARMRFRNVTERGEAYVEPRILADAYADARDEELENDDVLLIARALRQFESSNLDFRFDYRRESVLRAEIGDVLLGDLGAPIDTVDGTFGTFTEQRERYDLGLGYEFDLSERTRLGFETDVLDVAYLDDQTTARSDYENATLAAVLTRLVDLRNEVSATIYASDFKADRNDNDTSTVGVRGSFLRPITPTLTFRLDAGVARTDYAFLAASGELVENANNYFTFGFQFDKRSERTTWTFGAERALNPSNDGFLARRDNLRVQARHQLTPRWTLSTGLRLAHDTRVAATSIPNNARDYGRFSLQVEWLMTRRWSLITGIDSVRQEYSGVGADATSNSVVFGVRYQGLSQFSGATPPR